MPDYKYMHSEEFQAELDELKRQRAQNDTVGVAVLVIIIAAISLVLSYAGLIDAL